MTFAGAVQSGLKNYANFKGRATRAEFWYFNLFTVLLFMVTATFDSFTLADTNPLMSMVTGGPLSQVASIALVLPNLTVTVRRFHDAGFSGKWLFLRIVPFVALFLGGALAVSNSPNINPETATDQQLLDAASPMIPALVLLAAVGIFELVITLLVTKSAAQGNKYTESNEASTSAPE